MAIKEAKTNTDLDALFTQLAEPFDPNQIKWRVTHTCLLYTSRCV